MCVFYCRHLASRVMNPLLSFVTNLSLSKIRFPIFVIINDFEMFSLGVYTYTHIILAYRPTGGAFPGPGILLGIQNRNFSEKRDNRRARVVLILGSVLSYRFHPPSRFTFYGPVYFWWRIIEQLHDCRIV